VQDDFLPEQEQPEQRRRRCRPEQIAFGMTFFGVLLLLLAGSHVPTMLRLISNEAVPGTYVVGESITCTKGSNACFSGNGRFVSDDGTVVHADVLLQEIPKPVQAGDRVRAIDVGEPGEVFVHDGRTSWPYGWPIGLGLVGSLLAGFGSWRLWRWWKS
jgi:hypothetical protein